MYAKVTIITVVLSGSIGFGLGAFAPSVVAEVNEPPGVRSSLAKSGDPVEEIQKLQSGGPKSLSELMERAKRAGYVAYIGPSNYGGVDVRLERSMIEKRGLFGARWETTETINLRYFKSDDGLFLTNAYKIVKQRPPVGDWKVLTENQEVPAEFWNRTLESNSE